MRYNELTLSWSAYSCSHTIRTQHGTCRVRRIILDTVSCRCVCNRPHRCGHFRYRQDRPTDPCARAEKRDVRGAIHDLFSLVVFIPLFIVCFVFSHLFAASSSWGWQLYSIATGIFFGMGFVLFARGFANNGKFAGLFQRLTIAIGWIWLALIAAHLLALI